MVDPTVPPSVIVPASLWKQLTTRELKHVVTALRHKEFRFFLAGSFLSNIGTWMQSVAQAWLVLQLTNSPFYLGLDGFANTLPIAIFSLWGGVIADRFDRRKMLLGSQFVLMVLALALAVLTQLKLITVWEVILFSFCTGVTQAIAWPVYQTVLANIVQREHMSNAIALNSTQFNLARMIGPVLGALALSSVGTAGCFYANAVSFLAVIYALMGVHQPANRRPPGWIESSFLQSMREGLEYVSTTRALKWFLITMAITTLFSIPLVTLMPVFARDILHVGASGYGIMVAAFGAGAVTAGVLVAVLGDFRGKGLFVARSITLFVVGMFGFAVSRNLLLSVLCLYLCGFAMVGYASVINTIIQNAVPDHLRGRAMSLFVFAFGGCMPFGNLLAGYFAKAFSAPATLVGQGVVLSGFALFIYLLHPEIRATS